MTENPVGMTTYTYDALDDLTNVAPVQGTGRGFTYNSLKRLTGANSPELIGGNNPNGTMGYTYDRNGNLQTRSAGGITSTYGYDELDELTSKIHGLHAFGKLLLLKGLPNYGGCRRTVLSKQRL